MYGRADFFLYFMECSEFCGILIMDKKEVFGMIATTIFMELSRWVFVILAAYILIRCIRSLLQTKNPAEVWAYLHIKT